MVSMNKIDLDKSLDELDPVKMLLFFLAFVAISLFMMFVLIVPSVKEYKSVKVNYKRQEMSTSHTKSMLDGKKQTLDEALKKNEHVIKALSNPFDKERFLLHVKKYFKNASLSEAMALSNNENYSIYELNVTSMLSSPSSFYKFLDSLSDYENIIKADFPIAMKSNNKEIYSTFNIKVYNQE